jgi:hypothetical protein
VHVSQASKDIFSDVKAAAIAQTGEEEEQQQANKVDAEVMIN